MEPAVHGICKIFGHDLRYQETQKPFETVRQTKNDKFLQAVALILLGIWFGLPVQAEEEVKEPPPAYHPHNELPAGRNDHSAHVIDTYFETLWEHSGVSPSEPLDDAAFLRRASLALNGTPASSTEVEAFLGEPSPTKRVDKVNELLGRSRYADYWAFRLRTWVVGMRDVVGQGSDMQTLYQYCRQALAENRSWARVARDFITSEGNLQWDGRNNFSVYFDGKPNEYADAITRFFLGMNITCAQCHDDPHVKSWKQESYWGLAAYFGRTKAQDINDVNRRKETEKRYPPLARSESSVSTLPGGDAAVDGKSGENRIVMDVEHGEVSMPDPKNPQQMKPTPLGGVAIEEADGLSMSRRKQLLAWVLDESNPYFARTAVNRFFLVLTGRGFVDSFDAFSPTVPARHEELLTRLAKDFADHEYDLKWLMRTIVLSRIFQLQSKDDPKSDETWHTSRRRQLNSDQWHDSVLRVTGEEQRIYGMAEAITPLLDEERSRRLKKKKEQAKAVLVIRPKDGEEYVNERLPDLDRSLKPVPTSLTEAERETLLKQRQLYQGAGNRLKQSRDEARGDASPTTEALLHMNGRHVSRSLKKGNTVKEIVALSTAKARLDRAFVSTLGRYPSPSERQKLQEVVRDGNSESIADLLWALMQSTEFLTY